MLMVNATRGIAVRYVLGLFSLIMWPLGWAVANLMTDALLAAAADRTLYEFGGVLGQASYAPQMLFFILVASIWLLGSTIGAPIIMSRVLTSGAQIGAALLGGFAGSVVGGASGAAGGAALAGGGGAAATLGGAALGGAAGFGSGAVGGPGSGMATGAGMAAFSMAGSMGGGSSNSGGDSGKSSGSGGSSSGSGAGGSGGSSSPNYNAEAEAIAAKASQA